MSLDADAIVDRRRLRRKLTFWRVAAVLVVLVAIAGAVFAVGPSRFSKPGDYVARIRIQGLIRNNQDRVEALARLSRSRAKAVIVHIDSPGGTTAGSQQLYDSLRDLQAKKPMVVVVDGLAASGAYIAALSSEHIIAEDTSLVGSIGVLFQFPNFSDVLKTIGVKVESIKSSPLKAAPNGFEPTSPEARAAIEAIVLDSYAWFKDLVRSRRNMTESQLSAVSDGRVFTGRQAVPLKLIDGIGNEKAALAWLEKEKKVPANTPVRNVPLEPRFSELSFLHVAAWGFDAVGLSAAARWVQEWGGATAVERLNLDGLLALWHPPSSQ
ncbi:MAG TPA: signal peptide peptidase SppA [Pseudolabrys sp.]|jgi:protease-4|nr:signal peptide peptidase SppA [Pseudolabrys sp.]HEX2536735.1 signal peptide peptidase SppA [Pseudolabrys sp.]